MKYLKIITTTILLITLATLSSQAQAVIFEYDAAGNMIKRSNNETCYYNYTVPANAANNTQLRRVYTGRGTIKTQSIQPNPLIAATSAVDVIVKENVAVDFRANHITLQPGFKVEQGACFNAIIEPCEQ